MAKIVWSNYALADLNEIAEFIALDSPRYAQITVEKLYHKVEILKTHPKIGRIVPELERETVRELIEGNYRIIYEISSDQISVLTVHHSSRVLRSI